MKERNTDIPDSAHLASVGIFARGQRKPHPQHFQRWCALMNIETLVNILLLHNDATANVAFITVTWFEIIEPSRSFHLGTFWNVCFVDPIVDLMIVHVIKLCQPSFDHFLWIEQLATPVTVQVRLRFDLTSPHLLIRQGLLTVMFVGYIRQLRLPDCILPV